jgi:hypothetical protein
MNRLDGERLATLAQWRLFRLEPIVRRGRFFFWCDLVDAGPWPIGLNRCLVVGSQILSHVVNGEYDECKKAENVNERNDVVYKRKRL